MRARVGLGLGVIAALAIAIWAAVSQGGDEPPPTTTTSTLTTSSTESRPSSTSTTVTTTTTAGPSTTVTDTTTDPEARVEQVRQILQALYFGWFTAIHNKDEEAVREVIATERYLEDFRTAVTTLEYPRPPNKDEIVIKDLEILRDTENCLVTYSTVDLTLWLGEDATVSGVRVLLPVGGDWRFGTAWTHKEDRWQQDCDIEPELSP